MKGFFRKRLVNVSIKYKLMFVSMLTSIAVVLLASAIFTSYNIFSTTNTMVKEFKLISDIIGSNVAPFIEFSQRKSAVETLSALQSKKSVLLACTYNDLGTLFAQYPSQDEVVNSHLCPETPVNGHKFTWNDFSITSDILVKGSKIGSISILANLSDIKQQVSLYLAGLIASFVLIIIFAYLISSKLQTIISSPILKLTKIARQVKRKGDYTIRAEKIYSDETGELVDSFNRMLTEVEKRDNNLSELNYTITTMVNSLGQGFLTFGEDCICGNVYSKACEFFFGASPAGKNITEVLKLTKDETNDFIQWVGLVFSPSSALSFDDIKQLAPDKYTHFKEGQHLSFDYKAIYNDDKVICDIVLIVTDETKQFEAEELAQQFRNDAEILIKISRNKDHFISFIFYINDAVKMLQEDTKTPDLKSIGRELHTIKGSAGVFAMNTLANAVHEFEGVLRAASNNSKSVKEPFNIKYSSNINKIRDELARVMGLANSLFEGGLDKYHNMRSISYSVLSEFDDFLKNNASKKIHKKYINDILSTPIAECFSTTIDELKSLAENANKELEEIKIIGDPDIGIIYSNYGGLFMSFTHICRNMMDHGIESPDKRIESGKEYKGQITIEVTKKRENRKDWLQIKFTDDGNGIDPNKIREKLSKSKSNNKWKKESDEEVIQHIFDYNFSTRDEISITSGEGVGMDAVKKEAEYLKGKVWVESELGKGTSTFIMVPYLES